MLAVHGREVVAGALLGSLAAFLAVWTPTFPGAAVAAAMVAVAGGTWWLLADGGRWPVAFLAAACLLPPVPLPWGDSGVHPAALIAAIGLWAGVLRPLDWDLRPGFLAVALLLLVVTLLTSVPLAWLYSGASVAAGSLLRVGLFAISVYLFFYLAYGPGRHVPAERIVRLLLRVGLLSAAFATLDFYFQFPAPARFANQFVWLSSGIYRRAQGVFYEASTLGLFCVFLLVLALSILSMRMGGHLRLRTSWLLLACAIFLSALIYSFSRAAVLNLAVAGGLLAWISPRRHRHTWRIARLTLAAALCVIAGFALATYLFPEYTAAYLMRLQFSGEFLFSEPNVVLSRRLETWSTLFGFIAENPLRLLWGVGYKTLPYTDYFGGPVVADNMYLSLLIETGLPGLAALLLTCSAGLWQSLREARNGRTRTRRLCGRCLFCFWAGLMVQMLSGDLLTYWRVLPAFFALLAIGARNEDPVPRPVQ